jgi:hypothetical protein
MIGFMKSVQAVLQGILADLPDGVKVVTEFLYKMRWFIVGGVVLYGLYQMVMVVLPYLLWTLVIKMVIKSVVSLLIL